MSDISQRAAPEDFDTLRAVILERKGELPKRLTQVAAYALDHPDEIAFGTAASVAISAQVQPSTLVRFAQHFGFDGFSGLQQVFRARLRERNSSYEERLKKLEEGEASLAESTAILNKFISAAHRSVDALSAAIDPEGFEKAVEILAKADTIYLIAKRRSYPIASYMAYAFGKLKVRCQMVGTSAGIDDDLRPWRVRRTPPSPPVFPPMPRKAPPRPGPSLRVACRWFPSPILPFRRWPSAPASGSNWSKPTMPASAPFRPAWPLPWR